MEVFVYPVFILNLSSGEKIMLEKEIVIGRDENCSVFLNDERVSRRHARIWPQDDILHLVDLKSSNGTKLNGVYLDSEALVYIGDEIQMGKTSITIDQVTKETNLATLKPELAPQYSSDTNPTIVRRRLIPRNRTVVSALMQVLLFLCVVYAVIQFGFF